MVVHNFLLYDSRVFGARISSAGNLDENSSRPPGKIQRCRARAQAAVWWLKMSTQIREMIQTCPECVKSSMPPREPMISSTLPEHPWQKVASDLFQLHGNTYLLVVDYFSRYPAVVRLTTTTSQNIIKSLSSIFSQHGIPDEFISDNGQLYIS